MTDDHGTAIEDQHLAALVRLETQCRQAWLRHSSEQAKQNYEAVQWAVEKLMGGPLPDNRLRQLENRLKAIQERLGASGEEVN